MPGSVELVLVEGWRGRDHPLKDDGLYATVVDQGLGMGTSGRE